MLNDKSILFWMRDKKTETGDPIDFRSHYFLLDIYRDFSPKLAWQKPAQIGATTAQIFKTFWGMKRWGLDSIYCVDKETKCLTKRGFKYYHELKQDDLLMTLNIDSGLSEWQEIDELFVKDVETTMYEFEARNFNAFVTENHRWYVHDKNKNYSVVETKDMHKRVQYIPKTANIKTRKTYNDCYVELLAWVFSEGYYHKQKGKNDWSVTISQSERVNSTYCDEIRDCLRNNGVEWKEDFQEHSGCVNMRFAFELGKKIKTTFPDKNPTPDFINKLTKKQAQLFVKTFVKGDGWIDGSGTMAITQKDTGCVNMLAMAGVLAGYAPSVVKPYKNSVHGCSTIRYTQFNKVYCYELEPKIHENWKGTVWCPRVKNGNFYAMRNGRCYWTGNTLPTIADANEMSKGKINRLIAQNPELKELVKDLDTINQKRVGDNILYIRGTFTAQAAMMHSSDWNNYDEVDASKQEVIEQYSTRLQHSDYRWEHTFSHPSSENVGVNKVFAKSDQKHYFIKCPHCSKKQYLDMTNVEYEEGARHTVKWARFVCKKCKKELSDEDRRVGEWVAKHGGREISGYQCNLLMATWVTAKQLVEYKLNKSSEYFTNKVLGLPYVGSGNKVTWDVIRRNITKDINEQGGRIVIGVDTGTTTWYVVGNRQGIFYYGSCKGYDEIEKLLKRYPNSIAVFDQGGDLMRPRELQEKYGKGRIFLCHYRADGKTQQLVRWGEGSEQGTVIADRNRVIQMVVDEFTDGRIPLQMVDSEQDWYDYFLHWNNVYRVEEENHLGVPVKRWHRSGDDHWVHSTAYWRIGMSKFGDGGGMTYGGRLTDIKKAPEIRPDGTIVGEREARKHNEKPKRDWRIV